MQALRSRTLPARRRDRNPEPADDQHRGSPDQGRGADGQHGIAVVPATSVCHSHSTRVRQSAQNAKKTSRRNRPRRSQAAPAPAMTRCAAQIAGPPAAQPAVSLAGLGAGHGSGSGLRDQAAEPAFAPAIFGDRAFERGAVEVGPVGRNEHQFAVGRLPEQEVRQPLLAAGADDQIGVGQVGRVEIRPIESAVDRPQAQRRLPRPARRSARAARAISWRAP